MNHLYAQSPRCTHMYKLANVIVYCMMSNHIGPSQAFWLNLRHANCFTSSPCSLSFPHVAYMRRALVLGLLPCPEGPGKVRPWGAMPHNTIPMP